MHQRKSKKILFYFFLLIIVSSISNNSINNFKPSNIKNINISGLDKKNNQIIFGQIKNLGLENIFFINKSELINLINSNSLIERYEVIKKYPFTLNVKIKKADFLARINKNGKTYIIGSNGKLILLTESNYKELPFIFGKPNINEFLKFKKILDNSKFSYHQIKDLYFFQSKKMGFKIKK